MNLNEKHFIIFLLFALFAFPAKVYCEEPNIKNFEQTFLQEREEGFLELSSQNIKTTFSFKEYDVKFDKNPELNNEVKDIVQRLNSAERLYAQGNVTVSAREFSDISGTIAPNDFYYMETAQRCTDRGFFSIAEKTLKKISDTEIWGKQISAINKYLMRNYNITREEEILLAEIYSDITYNDLYAESIERLEKQPSNIKKSNIAHFLKAAAYSKAKYYQKALNEIEKSCSKDKDNLTFALLKAEILRNCGKYKKALKTLKPFENVKYLPVRYKKEIDKIKYHTLFEYGKKDTDKKYALAKYFYLNEDYSRAIGELTTLVAMGENKKAPELLGEIYLITGDYSSAKKVFEKKLSKKPKTEYALIGAGKCAVAENNIDEALKYFERAYAVNSKNAKTAAYIANIYLVKKDLKNAEKFIKIAGKSNSEDYFVNYINALIMKNENSKTAYLKKSLSENPLFAQSYLELAKKSLDEGNLTEGEEYVNSAAVFSSDNYEYFYLRYLTELKRRGNTDITKECIQKARKLYRKDKDLNINNLDNM